MPQVPSDIGNWLIWNPPREAFFLPLLHWPVHWYGLAFTFGFLVAYLIVRALLTDELGDRSAASVLADKLCWFTVVGTVVGARLGAVLLYDFEHFIAHPTEIFRVWNGGLASHGGVVGVVLASFLCYRLYAPSRLSFLRLLDTVAVGSAFVAGMIRIGNFMNQEIVGEPTHLPWGVVFVHPAESSTVVPRHPVQLYEAFAYFATFFLLLALWKQRKIGCPGWITSLLFTTVFGSRIVFENFKAYQPAIIDQTMMSMGQWLSLPLLCIGIAGIILLRPRAISS